MVSTLGFSNNPGLDAINSGSFDGQIDQWAGEAKAIGKPFFLRMMWEMNGSWTPYSISTTDPGTGSSNTYAEYVSAWQHIVYRLRSDGVTNAAFVWCPHWQGKPAGLGSWRGYYPGDAYVDWVCLDGYNSAVTSWKQMKTIISYGVYADYHATKPVMIGETASLEDPATPGRKGTWITQLASDIQTSFPDLKAFVWWGKGADYRVDSSPSSLDAYKRMGVLPYFTH